MKRIFGWSAPRTFVEIATVAGGSGSTKTYTDSTVADSTTYWYRVRYFVTPSTFSTYSNEASNNSGVVCAPSNLTVTALVSACDRLNISFLDNSLAEDEFRLERATAGGSCAAVFGQIAVISASPGSGGTVLYQNTGLLGGVQYCYRARAYNLAFNRFSAYSNCSCATVTSCGATK
jgi:hypothetical protein